MFGGSGFLCWSYNWITYLVDTIGEYNCQQPRPIPDRFSKLNFNCRYNDSKSHSISCLFGL